MKWILILVAIAALSSCSHSRKRVPERQSRGFKNYSSLNLLPVHIRPVRGQLSLTADFPHANEGYVTLYLINATKKSIAVPKQDGDLYCKREAKTADGAWRRCDTHQSSWCGNSYGSRDLPAGSFLSWQQMLDSKHGKLQPVRFRLFSTLDVKSNEGSGKIADAEIQFCRFDAMAMSSAPFEDVAAVATGEVQGSQGSSLGDNTAIPALARFAADPRMFPVLKRAVSRLVRQVKKLEGSFFGDEDKAEREYKHKSYDFRQCLQVLHEAKGGSVSSQECWDYVAGFVNDPHFPWSDEALEWLLDNYPQNKVQLRTLMEGILSKPGHAAMREAMFDYADVADRKAALQKLDAIAAGAAYSAEEHELAKDVKETLLWKWKKA